MKSILILLLALVLISCSSEKPEENDRVTEKKTITQETKPDEELPPSLTAKEASDIPQENEETRQLKSIATSFHSWYIKNINDTESKTPIEVSIVEGEAGKSKVESKPYFDQLRSLGTVSEKFIQQEKQRVAECADKISNVNWIDYNNADAYEYDKHCNFLYYYYWIRSQEPFTDVEVNKLEKNGDGWNATLRFFTEHEGEKNYDDYYHPIVTLEYEEGNWKITQIN